MPFPQRHLGLEDTPWEPVPERLPAPPEGTVHLHTWPLASPAMRRGDLAKILSVEERRRAGKFYFRRDRDAFVTGRGTLRQKLAGYLCVAPGDIRFAYGKAGKPFLDNAHGSRLTFNLSHAGGHALLAVAWEAAIGVDLEREDPEIDIKQLARRFFSHPERTYLLTLETTDRVRTFFRTWTRKEAFIKAHGAGLGLPLDQFSVSTDLSQPAYLESIDWSPGEERYWSLASFTVERGLPAALAVRMPLREVCYFRS